MSICDPRRSARASCTDARRNPSYRGSANRWRSAASWVATLPSYTVLPMRVDHAADDRRIHLGRHRDRAADRRAEPLLQPRRLRRGGSGVAVVTSACTIFQVLHHALVKHRRPDRSAARVDRAPPGAAAASATGVDGCCRSSSCATTARLRGRWHGGTGEHRLQIGMRAHQIGESGQLLFRLLRVDSVIATSNSALAYRAAEARVLMVLRGVLSATSVR